MVDLSLVRMFSESELSEVISGRPHVDLEDLQANVKYTFGCVSCAGWCWLLLVRAARAQVSVAGE